MKLHKREIVTGGKPRKSTAMLALAWIGVFVLYLFVKPEDQAGTTVLPLSGLLPAAVTQSEPAPATPGE